MFQNYKSYLLLILFAAVEVACSRVDEKVAVQGWNILSEDKADMERLLEKAPEYGVNHLQISHQIVHDLRQVKKEKEQKMVNDITLRAHEKGIDEVYVWDHALYKLNYYPSKFRRKKDGKIDLDNPAFWEWFKADYRSMIDRVPDIDGIVLTFIETGARIEEQYSKKWKTKEEKLAALVDIVADVVINEYKKKLIVRTFIYEREELKTVLGSLKRIKNEKVSVMCKEVPHDFFITHPTSWWIKDIKQDVIIEFDCTHEFSGQSVVATIVPEVHMKRWKKYRELPNVKGFCIRTSRYGNTLILDRPSGVNLFALHQLVMEKSVSTDQVVKRFISEQYGVEAVPFLKKPFQRASDIIQSVYYTLGINSTYHSRLDFHYRSVYTRHVSGRWMDRPNVYVGHDVNRDLHYWTDIVNHLAPIEHKQLSGANKQELKEVFEHGWLDNKDLMNVKYLNYIIKEKKYAVKQSVLALKEIEQAKPYIENIDRYEDLYQTFYRTMLSAKLFKCAAEIYYSNRILSNMDKAEEHDVVRGILNKALVDLEKISGQYETYSVEYPVGQYDWKKDLDVAKKYVRQIAE
ncbi:hypothetical protein EYV94_05090 [Puteibacter caeruleilacunae]|nr:hypothetical protein EYV94_05090 [Puteibacter caeruleilacunae]